MANTIDRTAIITGGSRGLGRNAAVNIARRGIDIIFTYHWNSAEAQSLTREIESVTRNEDLEWTASSVLLRCTTYLRGLSQEDPGLQSQKEQILPERRAEYHSRP